MGDHQTKTCLEDQRNNCIEHIILNSQKYLRIGKKFLIILDPHEIHRTGICCPFEHTVIDVQNDRKKHKHGNQSNSRQQKGQQIFFVLI